MNSVENIRKNGNPLEWTAVLFVVRPRGLEPLSVFGMEPKSIAYTIFATGAYSVDSGQWTVIVESVTVHFQLSIVNL